MMFLKYEGKFKGKDIEFNINPQSGINDEQIRERLKAEYGNSLVLSDEEPKLVVNAVL